MFSVIFVAAGSTASIASTASWKTLYTKKGITVSSRSVDKSSFKEFQGIGIIDAPLEVLIAVLQDVDAMPQWMPDCKKVRLISRNGNKSALAQVTIDFPAPMSDRYIMVHSEGAIDSEHPVVNIRMKNIKGSGDAVVKNLVRVPHYRGIYRLEYLSRCRTRLTYRVHIHPGGSVPSWMVNLSMKKSPYTMMIKLREMVVRKKYLSVMNNSKNIDRDFLARILTAIFRKKVPDENLIKVMVSDPRVLRICMNYRMSDQQIEEAIAKYMKKEYRNVNGTWYKK